MLSSLSIHHCLPSSHTPKQYDLTEQKVPSHCTHFSCSSLHWLCLPSLLANTITMVVFLNNCLPPYKFWRSSLFSCLYGYTPSHPKLCTFDCACYPCLCAYLSNKVLFKPLNVCFQAIPFNTKVISVWTTKQPSLYFLSCLLQ